MDAVTAPDQEALLEQLAQARERVDALAHDLHAVDGELAAIAAEREQHGYLREACRSLEKLGETGAAGLFWGEGESLRAGEEQLSRARSRLDAFEQRVGGIEARRQSLIAELEQHQARAYLLEDDVFEAQEEEERRRQEWIVEREIGAAASRSLIMPWSRGGEDDRRFRKSLATALLIGLLFAIVIPQIDVPLHVLADRTVAVPERVVRMMMESRPKPPPAPTHKDVRKPEERVAEQRRPEPVPQKARRQEKPDPTQEPTPGPVDETRPEKGILAFRQKLDSMKNAEVAARLGLQARLNSADDNATGPPQRSMLTTNGPGSSGGIKLASLSRGLGGENGSGAGGSMAGVQVSRVTSAIGGGGGSAAGADRPKASGVRPGRTDEEIQIVFDRYKAALYRLYNRELRKDPTLRGQMVLRLTIEPDGSVSMCVLQSSDMNAPELSAQVVDRVRTINFGAKDVAAITIVYPIDFLPAA